MQEATWNYIPDPNLPYLAFSDASTQASSFCLTQLTPENELRMVACHSKCWNSSEIRRHIFRLEVLSCENGLLNFHGVESRRVTTLKLVLNLLLNIVSVHDMICV